jgi:transcriptional regulator with XRE-family HTH domain
MTKKADLAVFIASKIDASDQTQSEIAAEAGLENPNFLSMIRTGKSRVPIGRALALADALDIPRGDMVRKCLDAYEPELYAILLTVFPGMGLSDEEFEIIKTVRAARALPPKVRRALRSSLIPVT